MRVVHQTARRFSASDEGNLTVFSALMIVLILTIAGAAVDIMRSEAVRARMQSTMDRAVLAAADLDQQQDPETVVRDYVAKLGVANALTNVSVAAGENDRVVSADGAVHLNTIFMRLAGVSQLHPVAQSTAEERIANVEVSLVLDISGSMRWNQRMERMKPAAQAFVDKVLTDKSKGITTLNVIPFAGQVNPGDVMFDYFRGERPKIKHDNNGWGNGDQDAPGGSLCNNGAENEVEGSLDPSCTDGALAYDPMNNGYFPPWPQAISNVVLYFDTDGDDIFDRAHKIESFPEDAPRDFDDLMQGAAAYVAQFDPNITDTTQILGVSIKGGQEKTQYFTIRGNYNGTGNDLGPTKNQGKIPGMTLNYTQVNYDYWAQFYTEPLELADEPRINMPSSCVEIYDEEFADTAMPLYDDYVPHFMYWDIAEEVMDWGWCPEDDTAIQYYSDDAAALKEFIGNIRMHDGTGIQYGMKYALALLDPNTADAVSHLVDAGLVAPEYRGRPLAWEDPETEKYVVIMTDGKITDQHRPIDPRDPENGVTELQFRDGADRTILSSQSNNVANLFAQCDLARQRGVVVFTIAFETDQSAADDMRACASSDSHFFRVEGEEIVEAFDTIARQINNLRLIQ